MCVCRDGIDAEPIIEEAPLLERKPVGDLVPRGETVSLAEKIAFLGRAEAYPFPVQEIVRRETHMSWVFLAGDQVVKLKKPVRFPYLDFSSLSRREAACRAELALNRRLAPDIYRAVVPLTQTARGLAIGGEGEPVDWLVIMRRLDESRTLEHALLSHALDARQLDHLVVTLVTFYQRADAVLIAPEMHLANWRRSTSYNKRVLLDPRLGLPAGLVRKIDQVQCRFLARRYRLIERRVRRRHIVDGHGDLRPEHIWLTEPTRIIDCLEFNPGLRIVDPFDEVAFLSVECERLGGASAAAYIKRRISRGLRDGLSDELFLFYRCYRATLRARLAIAHLLESQPRTPEKWPRLARIYLQIAANDAKRLDRLLRRQGDRSAAGPRAIGGSSRPSAAPPKSYRSWRDRRSARAGMAEPRR
jgi:aminoglycoside phosphotransferase family enzyme